MNERALLTLEFDKILERLTRFCSFENSQESGAVTPEMISYSGLEREIRCHLPTRP